MAELLVRVVDKINHDDPYLDAKCLKAGDVVVVCPDGWVWGREELANPEWRIVRVPGLTVEQCAGFLSEEPETDPTNPNPMRQRRGFRLEIEHGRFDQVRIETRKQRRMHRLNLSLGELMAHKVAKPKLDDPNVFN